MCLCVCICTYTTTCTVTHVKVREQISRVSLLLLCWSQGTISDIHSLQPAWLTEPCHQPIFFSCSFVILVTCFAGIRFRVSSFMLHRVTLSLKKKKNLYTLTPLIWTITLCYEPKQEFCYFFFYISTTWMPLIFFSYFINSEIYVKGIIFVFNIVVHFIFSYSRTL